MPLPQTVVAGQTGHLADHDEIHELLASMDGYANVAGFASLQAAHDALPSGGGVLYFPPGYQLTPTATTTITKPVQIIGGPGSKLIQGGDGTTYHLLTVSAVTGFELRGLTLDGRYPTRTSSGNLIRFTGTCAKVRIVDCEFIDSHGAIFTQGAVTDLWIERCRITNSAFTGITFADAINRAWVVENLIDTTQDAGIFAEQLDGVLVQQNVHLLRNEIRNSQRSGGAGKAGIQTRSSTTLDHRRWEIVGNHVINLTSGGANNVGIGLDQISDSIIASNHVLNPAAGETIVICGPRNRVENNHCENHDAGGISFLSYGDARQCDDEVCVGNTCIGSGTANPQGIAIVATAVAGQNISNLLIAHNRCKNSNYGIQSYNNGGTISGTNIMIHGNILAGNGSGSSNFVAGTNATLSDNL